jgi:hypothetical protein
MAALLSASSIAAPARKVRRDRAAKAGSRRVLLTRLAAAAAQVSVQLRAPAQAALAARPARALRAARFAVQAAAVRHAHQPPGLGFYLGGRAR